MQVVPHIASFLPERDLLNCRFVCKSWENGVNSLLECHADRRPFIDSSSIHQLLHGSQTVARLQHDAFSRHFCFRTCHQLEMFQTNVALPKTCFRNSFMGRCVSFKMRDFGVNGGSGGGTHNNPKNTLAAAFWYHVQTEFLPHLGYHMAHIHIDTGFTLRSHLVSTDFIEFSSAVLELSPNLKSLSICVGFDDPHQESFFCCHNCDSGKRRNMRALPALNKLDTLILAWGESRSRVPVCITEKFLSCYSARLQRLEILVSDKDYATGLNLRATCLSTLTDLRIVAESLAVLNNLLKNVKDESSPALRRLHVHLLAGYNEPRVNVNQFWNAVSQFGETLLALHLNSDAQRSPPNCTDENDDDVVGLSAPNLEYLRIGCSINVPLSFLTGHLIPKLRYFNLDAKLRISVVSRRSYPSEEVDVYDYIHSGNMYNSNIWTLWPLLQKATFRYGQSDSRHWEKQSYNRETFEFLQS